MVDKEGKRRLAALEERAGRLHNESLKPKRRPYYNLEKDARSKGTDAWRDLMRRYGWTDQQIQDEEDWDSLVCDRIEASGLDGIFLMADMIRHWEATGDWDSYPGPGYGVRSTEFSPVCGLLGRVVPNGQMYVR
jgi:hypothetical protein